MMIMMGRRRSLGRSLNWRRWPVRVGSDASGTGGGASSEIDDGGVAGDGDGMKARLLLRASESSSSMLSVGSGGGLTPSREGTSR